MSIRDRLRTSYAAMLIIPLILSILAAIFLSQIYIRAIEETYDVQLRGNPLGEFMDKVPHFTEKIREISQNDPSKLKNMDYITKLDDELNNYNAGLVVRKSNEMVYISNLFEESDVEGKLPSFASSKQEHHGRLSIDNQPYLVKQYDFYFEDQTQGTVFLIINMSFISNNFKRFIMILLIVIILITIITNGVLTLSVSRSILNPLKSLEEAANQIKEGNLDFEIKNFSEDEIGQLCKAFEEMRYKLKESVEVQLQYERNRNELMGNISHDLKTPVTAIKGYVEGIMDGVADSPAKKERYIKTIYTKANDMDRLIDELLLYSKLDIKRLPFHFEKVDIVQFLRDIVEELQFDLEGKGIRLEMTLLDDRIPLILGDREKLKRVIGNIVDNAVKYMNKNDGRILVNLEKSSGDEGDIRVEIRDNGQGIPKEYVPLIFERFYRVEPSRNIATGGSGLGLAIAQRIIEEHGGKIWAESEEDQRTSIYFTLKTWDEMNGGVKNEENFNH